MRKEIIPASIKPVLIGTKAVALLLGRCERTIRRDVHRGTIPRPLVIGGSRRWMLDELRDWLEARCPRAEVWEARRAGRPSEDQPVENVVEVVVVEPSEQAPVPPVVVEDPQVQVPAAEQVVVVAPKERDLADFRRFLAAGCTRAEWESRRQQTR